MPPQANTEATYDRRIQTDGADSDESIVSPKSVRDYRIRKSRLIGMIDWTHVLGTHAPQAMILGIVVLLGQLVHQVATERMDIHNVELSSEAVHQVLSGFSELFSRLYERVADNGLDLFSPAVKTTALLLLIGAWLMRQQKPVYLLSFATFKAPQRWKKTKDEIVELMRRQKCFTDESIDFMKRILERSGTGDATAWPESIIRCLDSHDTPSNFTVEESRKEAETMIFDVVENALKKARVTPKEIDVLVINCSLFSPTPSLCAMVVSRFGLRSNVSTYNLSGMGCAASLISIDLAKQLLAVPGNRKALVVSTEVLTPNFYHGNERAFLIQNTLFRCGAAAMVLSNSWFDGRRAWYKLLHTVRVQGNGEAAYQCVYETEDAVGQRGVRLSKDIVKVAGKCMEKNFTMLGPSVLPITEQAKVVGSIVVRFFLKAVAQILRTNGKTEWANQLPTVKPYVPDFKSGIDHFCIHAGGRAVIDGIEKNMQLEPYHTEASRMTLYKFGNTSSSSIWYELEYIQEEQKTNTLKKGDRILQVAFGSGFKCTSGVWLKL